MLQAVEAIIRGGRIEPIEPISIKENTRFLLIRLQPTVVAPATSSIRRSPGSAKGRLRIVEDDDDHPNDFTNYMA